MTFFRWKRYSFADAWMLTVCGVTLRRAVHEEPEPAPSGAHLAIDSSIWLSTRRRAIGFGRVRDWARLSSIEVRPPKGAGPFMSETGDVLIAPAIALDPLAPFDVWIANHAPIATEVTVSVQIDQGWERNNARIDAGALKRMEFYPRAGIGAPPRLNRIVYQTYPIGVASRFARIHGRPEFGGEAL